jgi:hypothetical protein
MKRIATLISLAALATAAPPASAQPFPMTMPAQTSQQANGPAITYPRPVAQAAMPVAQPYPSYSSPTMIPPSAPMAVAQPTMPRATLASAPQYSAVPQYSPLPYSSSSPFQPAQPTLAPQFSSGMPVQATPAGLTTVQTAQTNSGYAPVPSYTSYMQPGPTPAAPQPMEAVQPGVNPQVPGQQFYGQQAYGMQGGVSSSGNCGCAPAVTPMFGCGSFAGCGGCGGMFNKPFGSGCGSQSNLCSDGTCGSGCGGGCGSGCCGGCGPGGCGPCSNGCWFGSIGGLVMTRNTPPSRVLAYTACGCDELLNTRNVTQGQWQGGFEARIGRCCSSTCAVEGVFWYLAPFSQTLTASSPGNMISSLNFTTPHATFINGTAAEQLFGSYGGSTANSQSLYRNDQVYNLELNVLNQPLWNNPGSRCGIVGIAGVRWFHFNEQLLYNSVSNVGTGNYNVRTSNDLIGPQLGARLHYYVLPNFRLYAIPKAGIFGNAASSTQQLYDGTGNYAFNYNNYLGAFSMLGQIDLGGSWQVTPRLSLYAAYRALGVSGLSMADYQIPQYMADYRALQRVDHSGALILQGVIAGAQFCF